MNKQEIDFHGVKFSIETNKIAKQADGSVMVRAGDSAVLVTVCLGQEKDVDFLPLTIDYQEKTYAAGKIPGGFLKREGRLSTREILNCRLIDRPCRPLFPKTFHQEIQILATVMSADPENDPDVLAMVGASAALMLSPAPFEGPIAGVRVCRIGGELKINPPVKDVHDADINFIIAGSKDAIMMVEGGADEASEEDVIDALFFGHQELQKLIEIQEKLTKDFGKEKIVVAPEARDDTLSTEIKDFAKSKIKPAVMVPDKFGRKDALTAIKNEIKEKFITENLSEDEIKNISKEISKSFDELVYDFVRELAFKEKKRMDGRDFTTVRQIDIDLTYLPRVHGSAVFTRGETQAIVAATLGIKDGAQRQESLLEGEISQKFYLHYNFPPYSVGEARPVRGPGRREIGHGMLAERALEAVILKEDNPYVIRIVSEITESNGSSSMASVCGGSLALLDAGIKIKAPVAGVAMGLLKDADDYAILTDILGDEDHLGDMDFKICGTKAGITALQMDIKIKGLSREIFIEALTQAKEGRLHILAEMDKAIKEPRSEMNAYAPKVETLKIKVDKIRDVIGSGGKVIKSIIERYNVNMDVTDDGIITIAATNADDLKAAIGFCKSITAEAEVGKVYEGIVKKITSFGAFVEILPNKDGLLHVSEISNERVEEVSDVLTEGEVVSVKVIEVDRQGKIRLSKKQANA